MIVPSTHRFWIIGDSNWPFTSCNGMNFRKKSLRSVMCCVAPASTYQTSSTWFWATNALDPKICDSANNATVSCLHLTHSQWWCNCLASVSTTFLVLLTEPLLVASRKFSRGLVHSLFQWPNGANFRRFDTYNQQNFESRDKYFLIIAVRGW
jgi:hypothetical protein